MKKPSIRLIPAAATLAVVMAFGGQAFAQTSPTSSAPVPTKDALDPANKTAATSMPNSVEARDAKASAKMEKKQARKNTKAGKKAARASNSYNASLGNNNAGDPGRPANSKP